MLFSIMSKSSKLKNTLSIGCVSLAFCLSCGSALAEQNNTKPQVQAEESAVSESKVDPLAEVEKKVEAINAKLEKIKDAATAKDESLVKEDQELQDLAKQMQEMQQKMQQLQMDFMQKRQAFTSKLIEAMKKEEPKTDEYIKELQTVHQELMQLRQAQQMQAMQAMQQMQAPQDPQPEKKEDKPAEKTDKQ